MVKSIRRWEVWGRLISSNSTQYSRGEFSARAKAFFLQWYHHQLSQQVICLLIRETITEAENGINEWTSILIKGGEPLTARGPLN